MIFKREKNKTFVIINCEIKYNGLVVSWNKRLIWQKTRQTSGDMEVLKISAIWQYRLLLPTNCVVVYVDKNWKFVTLI